MTLWYTRKKIISLIPNTYDGMTCNVTHAGRLTEKTGVRVPSITVYVPGCHRLDNENYHKNRRNGIQWTLYRQLDDLDFADDLTLLSHSHEQMQEKIDLLNLVSAQTVPQICST